MNKFLAFIIIIVFLSCNKRLEHQATQSKYQIVEYRLEDAFLENRAVDCKQSFIYTKQNIIPIKEIHFSKSDATLQYLVYIPGLNVNKSKLPNNKVARLELLFVVPNCLVGLNTENVLSFFCQKKDISKYLDWEARETYKTKILEIKFKDFPSKGIYVKLKNGIVVDAGILE